MPLIKSKSDKAVGKNISAEETAGKPHNQAVAIALSIQGRAKKNKMNEGGMANEKEHPEHEPESAMKYASSVAKMIQAKRKKMSEGGLVEHEDELFLSGEQDDEDAVHEMTFPDDTEERMEEMDSPEDKRKKQIVRALGRAR